jgi:hypothetical protein
LPNGRRRRHKLAPPLKCQDFSNKVVPMVWHLLAPTIWCGDVIEGEARQHFDSETGQTTDNQERVLTDTNTH